MKPRTRSAPGWMPPAGFVACAAAAGAMTLVASGCITASWGLSRLEKVHPVGAPSLEHATPSQPKNSHATSSPKEGPPHAGSGIACEKALRRLEEASPPRRETTTRRGLDELSRIASSDPIPVCRARALRILGRWAGRPNARGEVFGRLPLAPRAETIRIVSLERLESDPSPIVRLDGVENLIALGLPSGGEASVLLLARHEHDPAIRSRILDLLAEKLASRAGKEGEFPARSSLLATGLEAAASTHRGLALAGVRLLEALTGRSDVAPTEAAWVRELRTKALAPENAAIPPMGGR